MKLSVAALVTATLFALAEIAASATTIGTGSIVSDTDPSLAGQNITFNSALPASKGATGSTYTYGAGLLNLNKTYGDEFTRSLGSGPNQVQWKSCGGFTGPYEPIIDIGGQTPPVTLTWGQGGFVPDARALILDGVEFDNPIDLGADPAQTREIAIGQGNLLKGNFSGQGNLTFVPYQPGSYLPLTQGQSTSSEPMTAINIGGELTTNGIDSKFFVVTAPSLHLTKSFFINEVTGSPNVRMDGGSIWLAGALGGSPYEDPAVNQSVNQLGGTDPTSILGLGLDTGTIMGSGSTILTVQSGYFAGHIYDSFSQPHPDLGGALIKDGPGIFTLANDNSTKGTPEMPQSYYQGYSQGTIVRQGTLLCMNTSGSATGSGPIIVMFGGALGGPGIVAPTNPLGAILKGAVAFSGSVTVNTGIQIDPGGMLDLRAYDPRHVPTVAQGVFQAHLNPNSYFDFLDGANLGFLLAPGGQNTKLSITGCSANLANVTFNDNQVVFRALKALSPAPTPLSPSISQMLTPARWPTAPATPLSISLRPSWCNLQPCLLRRTSSA